jgi:hypothetical protein
MVFLYQTTPSVPFPWVKAFSNMDSKTPILYSALSMTPLTTGGQCQWQHWPSNYLNILASSSVMKILFENLVDDDQWLEVLMTPLRHWPLVGGVNDTADHGWAVSVTMLTTGDTAHQYWPSWPRRPYIYEAAVSFKWTSIKKSKFFHVREKPLRLRGCRPCGYDL